MSRLFVDPSRPTSSRIDSCSTGESEKFSSTTSLLPMDVPQDPEFVRMLQEDKIKVMRTRTVALFNENVYLKAQIHQERARTKEMEDRLIAMEDQLLLKTDLSRNIEDCKIERNEMENSGLRILGKSKPSSLCVSCCKKFQRDDADEPIVFITKTELSNLKKDMEELRDGLANREKAWEGMMEREQSYCTQLTRLAQEVITGNQLAENRGNDLVALAQILEERDGELKAAQRKLLGLKKLVAKYEKRNRAAEETKVENATTEMNEHDQKWIETIVRQISVPRGRVKSKGSNYSTPRSAQNSAREE